MTKLLWCSACQRMHAVRRPHADTVRESSWREAVTLLRDVAAGTAVLLLCFVALWLWLSIGTAVQP